MSYMVVSSNGAGPKVVAKTLFGVTVGLQIVVLLVQGTLFAGHMGSRERTSATLDFHRNSPESVAAKVFGLIFGSAWFEWAVFFFLFVVELFFVFSIDITVSQILLMNLSLILSGAFFHTVAATIALSSSTRKRRNPFGLILLFIFLGGPFIFYQLFTISSPFFSHLLGFTAIGYVTSDKAFYFSGHFYTMKVPLIVMQAATQIPLLWLMINGMRRIFRMPNSPVWSKSDLLCFCTFLFFMVAGFFVAGVQDFDALKEHRGYYYYPRSFNAFYGQELFTYGVLYVGVGTGMALFCIPDYFKRSKYILHTKKGLVRKSIFDDGATGFFAILVYMIIGGVFLIPYVLVGKGIAQNALVGILLLSSYVFAFAGFLEFFRLGPFRKNKIFLFTTMVLWWGIFPWMIGLMSGQDDNTL
ncbi:MAG: hypothetical protein KC618_07385, partial [Candidatus Omnitrophica bacterium]|nr:hypothetical protein [Candidatus Omnitrophota bacterium]